MSAAGGIHPTAVIDSAEIAEGVEIGAYAVVGRGARLRRGTVLHPHVVVAPAVELGENVEVFPGAFLGKEPKGAGAITRPIDFERRLRIGAGSSIGPGAVIYYDVDIGRETLIGDGCSVREKCRVGDRCLLGRYVTLNYNVVVGNDVKVMDSTHLTGNTRVGDGSFISILVATTNDNALGAEGYGEDLLRGPVIEAGAMIGAGANLLPGVRIGSGALVAAASVVTRDVEARRLVKGSPARPGGWICRCGRRLPDEPASPVCECGRAYTLSGGRLHPRDPAHGA